MLSTSSRQFTGSPPALPSRTFPSFWTLHIAGWSVLGLAMWVGVVAQVEEPARALVDKTVFAGLGALLTLALRLLYRRLRHPEWSLLALVMLIAACSSALSFVWSVLYHSSTALWWQWIDGEPLTVPPFSWLISGALLFTFIFIAWSVLYFAAKYYQDLHDAREQALAAEGMAHRARLEALRYQVNPHFLFNTLNSISTLIAERKNGSAEQMVARLSDFLRLTLDGETTTEVPLAEEIDFARRYLDIEQIRFGPRLRVAYDVDNEALSARVPPLILQPLVENAVRHGILPSEDGGHLKIEANRGTSYLLLRVADDGPGPSAEGSSGAVENRGTVERGVGLENVRARLEAHYEGDFQFAIKRADDGGCIARIKLPLRTDDRGSNGAYVGKHAASAPVAPFPLRTEQ